MVETIVSRWACTTRRTFGSKNPNLGHSPNRALADDVERMFVPVPSKGRVGGCRADCPHLCIGGLLCFLFFFGRLRLLCGRLCGRIFFMNFLRSRA